MAPPSHTYQAEIDALIAARHGNAFAFLGRQKSPDGGTVYRTFRPGARSATLITEDGQEQPSILIHPDGLFAAAIAENIPSGKHSWRFDDHDGEVRTTPDPYAFGNVLGDEDMYYFSEGRHWELYKKLGAHPIEHEGVAGTTFAVWAPNAQRVSVIGDFNGWDGRVHPMRKRIETGIWEIFLPGVCEGQHYKFEVLGAHGDLVKKSDPFALFSQNREQTASITHRLDNYQWGDAEWIKARGEADPYTQPISVYEVHLGSWARIPEEDNRELTYRELAERLPAYAKGLGFTHIELMPVTEFPFDGSWGYQVGGYFAPTSRYGSPEDFRYFVDKCHQAGLGVLLDWVPAHFPKDEHGLAQFDGTALFEHSDPRQGEHRDWGTLIFNYGRNEVRNFLIANALYWLKEFHLDGLRVDAVASMLYLDYSREAGEWIPNDEGGRENKEAIHFLKELNETCYAEAPGILMMAEESTSYAGVSKPTSMGGLGFGFKWNMGWMNDFLEYMAQDPINRKYHHGEATFSMLYAYDENFMLVLSHDEVVHGKGALLDKMPGDRWQKFANLRMFLAWMYAHPGKKLLFQGIELASWEEWSHDKSLDWHLLENEEHKGMQKLVGDLNRLYLREPSLHATDHDSSGFTWLAHDAAEDSVFAFVRGGGGGAPVVFAVNATPVPRTFRLGLPGAGAYEEILNTDAGHYAGSNLGNLGTITGEDTPWQNQSASAEITLPPLATVALRKV